ncbi:hypothetical protein AMTRI_Chr02g216120 [Amborella trichopoda]
MSPHKGRRVIDQIRGCSYEQTLMILELVPYGVSDSFISKAEVNGGAMMKKFKPKARGRSYPIKQHTFHITIVLKEKQIPL